MAYKITPGIKQDHLGRAFRTASWDQHSFMASKTISVPAAFCEPSKEQQRLMQRVRVKSLAFDAAKAIVPQNDEQARRLQRIIDAGEYYESCVFFQGAAE